MKKEHDKKRLKLAGELAMKLIADYPLYASTSGITYEEAIAVARALYGDKKWIDEALNLEREE